MQRGLEKLEELVMGTVQKKAAAAAAAQRLLPVNLHLHLKKKTSLGAGVNKTMPDFRH